MSTSGAVEVLQDQLRKSGDRRVVKECADWGVIVYSMCGEVTPGTTLVVVTVKLAC